MTKILMILFATTISGCSWLFPLRGEYELVSYQLHKDSPFLKPQWKGTMDIGISKVTINIFDEGECKIVETYDGIKTTDKDLSYSSYNESQSVECKTPDSLNNPPSGNWIIKKIEGEIEVDDGRFVTRWKKL